jgi:hypothetical protein
MTGLREIKRQVRRDVHEQLGVPVVYVAGSADPVRISVRVHTRFQTAKQTAAGAGGAEMLDITPRLIFDRLEVSKPKVKALVFVSETEGYRVGPCRPADDEFVTAEVTALSAADLADLWDDSYETLLA